MKNVFFSIAKRRATRLLKRRARMLLLLAQLAYSLRGSNWRSVDRQAFKDKFLVLGRLTKRYIMGQYKVVPWRAMIIAVTAIVYFISPVDLIPDVIPVTGLSDDFGVLVWVYNAIGVEVDKFLLWEKSKFDTL